MVHIERHDPGLGVEAGVKRRGAGRARLTAALEQARQHPANLLTLAQAALDRAGWIAVDEPDPTAVPELSRCLTLAARGGTAALTLALSPGSQGDRREVFIGAGPPFSPPPHSYPGRPRARHWLQSYWLAQGLGLADLTATLTALPTTPLTAADDGLGWRWCRWLQAFQTGEPQALESAAAALGAEGEGVESGPFDAKALIPLIAPVETLLLPLVAGDTAAFAAALEAALLAHRHHWESHAPADPGGFFALAPWVLATWASRRGLELAVTSDYWPWPPGGADAPAVPDP
ncbi:MAG: Imm49 family immunity protein [Candidatus Competibacterales bacterium]